MPHIYLPTLHQGQVDILLNSTNRNAVRCGRRYGKTKMIVTLAGDRATKGKKVGIFTPERRQWTEPYDELIDILDPLRKRGTNKTDGTIRLRTKGLIDCWHLDDNLLAGRGREYDDVLIDEAAFTKDGQMLEIWEKAIEPTLLTTRGSAWVFSTPNGDSDENFFHEICRNPKYGFKEFHAPTSASPFVPPEELEKYRLRLPPLVFKQEYLAEFVDWSGVQFFELEKLLVDGKPVVYPEHIDGVFATIDSATKAGQEHDGTAVCYWGVSKHYGHPLVLLDWDIVQIEGSLLETWLPTVFQHLEHLAVVTKARAGSVGALIEDKASGTILIQQAQRRGWPAQAIDSKLTAMGKDERAISVSGYVYRGEVKISQHAYDKVCTFKGQSKNHLLNQVLGFKIGDKEARKRADDLADTFMYGVAIALGNYEGF